MNKSGFTRTVTLAAGLALSLLVLHPARAEASPVIPFELVVNVSFDGTGHCFGSVPSCSGFTGKQYVWLLVRDLVDGIYFFSVLNPGSADANDGAPGNLSDDFDSFTNRTFTVRANELFSYAGTHNFDIDETNNNDALVRLFPFANTSDPSGTYDVAVCALEAFDAHGVLVPATGCTYNSFAVNADGGAVPAVPEPASLVLMSTGLAFLVRRRGSSSRALIRPHGC